MLDTMEQTRITATYDLLEADDRPTVGEAMVPMLDWPSDLFNTFTTEVDDEFE
jgi:hypothetical protein